MQPQDAVIFLLSADWFYSDGAKSSRLLPMSANGYGVVSDAAKMSVKKILSGESNYYFIDFSEKRLSKSRSFFLELIKKKLVSLDYAEVVNFLEVLSGVSSGFSKDASILLTAYRLACASQSEAGAYLRSLFSAGAIEIIEMDFDQVRVLSEWDAWINTLFEGNDSEVFDYYMAVVVPVFFARQVSVLTSGFRVEIREWVFDFLCSISSSSLGSVLTRERIVELHGAIA